MRIKQLELVGFKSFPQRTLLDFPRGVTGVVGPNGCGKSNVVDAIRWVLGEQSAKHLRGDAMESVIFNGNEQLSPLGMAEVSLTFENDTPPPLPTDLDLEVSTLPAHIRELPEITVTRRYYRSGEAEYLINRMPCRLKDITELFLGTGVGSKAYAIIEQGRVGELINAKPEDRRLFIEEAAGTTLYRARKLAAERKMERTRENLARVNDILHEIDRQTQYLERQAKKAEVHKRLVEELRGLEVRVSGRQYQALQHELAALDATRERLAADAEALRGELDANQQAHQTAATAVADAEHRHAAAREQLAVLEAERHSVQQRIAMLEEQRAERERRHARLGEDAEAARVAQATAAERLRQAEREREAAAQYLCFDEGALRAREEELNASRAALARLSGALEVAKGALVEHVTRAVEVRNALAGLARRREEIARQLDKLRAEDRELERRREDVDAQLAARRADLERLRGELARATGEQEARANELRALAEARRRWEREAVEVEGIVVQATSRLESLAQIQANYEGFHRGVRAIMREEHHPDGVLGVVADVIDIPQQYERAVAAVLGERLQYVIVRGEEEGAEAVDRLRQEAMGRSASSCSRASRPDGGAEPQRRLAADARPGAGARRVPRRRPGPARRGGAGSGPRHGDHHVARARRARDAGDARGRRARPLGGDHRRLGPSDRGGTAGAPARDRAAARRGDQPWRATGRGSRPARGGRSRHVRRRGGGQGAGPGRAPVVADRRGREGHRAVGDRAAAVLQPARRGSLRGRQPGRGGSRRGGRGGGAAAPPRRADRAASGVGAGAARAARRDRRIRGAHRGAGGGGDGGEGARRRAARAPGGGGGDRGRVARPATRAGRTPERAAGGTRAGRARARRAGAGPRRRPGAPGRAGGATRRVGGRRGGARRRWPSPARPCARWSSVRARCRRGSTSCARPRARPTSRARRPACAANTWPRRCGRSTRSTWPAPRSTRPTATTRRSGRGSTPCASACCAWARSTSARSTSCASSRSAAGSCAPSATISRRSLADLERTIQKLNRASRTKFAETFARANETFQKVFPRLFRGGEGRLVLTDENDLLETGVEIVVRPPGKRLDTVNLLSGGEKALVAVSLIFSLFLINPTPFCILDEVDAPLDDANIGRFSQMVNEMSTHSQFILITHNKRTMESADVLYGITMQEPGVSKVISVAIS
ncbi:MAG: AAA family ATPase [Candidatus Binatia bacterium]